MRQPKTFLLLSVIVAVLILGVAYAAISNINLEISGTAQVDPSQANFDVRFLSNADISFDKGITSQITGNAKVTGNTTAEITVSGMSVKNETAVAEFTVKNYSTDLAANISVNKLVTGDSEFFYVHVETDKTFLAPGEETNVRVGIRLEQTLISDEPNISVQAKVIAVPVYGS